MHFERNHNLIPEIDVEDYALELYPRGNKNLPDDYKPMSISFEELKAMPEHTLVSYISCAGNKRRFLQAKHPNIKGLKWGPGAIGNSVFKGVTLRYILLEKMGLTEAELKGKHLIAYAYDADF